MTEGVYIFMARYFSDSDFMAFREDLAYSNSEKVIAARMTVVEKLRDLHEQELKEFMNSKGLHEHWQKAHLTSVVWPLKQANNEYVNYVRMGYGKPKNKIDELANMSGLKTMTTKGYLKDDMAFHYITQLQVALNEVSWEVSLYLDDLGWFEQHNLVNKIESNKSLKGEMISLLESLQDEEYILYLAFEAGYVEYDDAEEYIDDIIEKSNSKISFGIHICKSMEKDSDYNDYKKILPFLTEEYLKLMPLYKFMSWDRIQNSYL